MGAIQSQYGNQGKNRVVWQWEHQPNDYRSYPPEVCAQIEKHYLSGSTSALQIKGINLLWYQIDLKELVQTNVISKKRRKIKREISRDPNGTIRWSWENEYHEMVFYTVEISQKIEAHFQNNDQTPLKVYLHERQYNIDPFNKTQTNLHSKKQRRIERNIIPGDKYIWQWQHEDGNFISYSENDSAKIEQNYSIRKKEPYKLLANGREILVDAEKFVQIESQTNKASQIRRVKENFVKYGWSWKDENGMWNPFSLYFVEKLEKNYLSTSRSPLLITINGRSYEIDTKEMLEKSLTSGKCYNIKREALSNDRATWLWISKDSQFKAFPSYLSHLIESQYMLKDLTPIVCEFRGKRYQLNIEKMEKTNLDTNSCKRIKRKVIPNNYPSELETLSKSERKEVFEYLSTGGHIPADWNSNQEDKVNVYSVSDIEMNMIIGHYDLQHYHVSAISRIQNQPLINHFLLERANIRNYLHEADEPTLLFYLSDKTLRLQEILENQECTLEGKFSPLLDYGQGFYFTKNPRLASQYALEKGDGEDRKKVLVCFWVLLGRIASINDEEDQRTFYDNKYNSLADIKKEPKDYDSVSGIIQYEEVYVLYKPERCYPLYMIEYRDI